MCYYGSSSTRQPVPATNENIIKYGRPSTVASAKSDNVIDNDIQRRQIALRNQLPENREMIYKTKLGA